MPQDLQQYFAFSPFFVGSDAMSDLEWEKLQDKIDKMPISLYNMMVDAKTSEVIEALTQKYIQLSVQGSDIARLVRDVVIADVFVGDMPAEISKLGLDAGSAREVANSIVSQLFAPVLEDIKGIQSAKFPEKVTIKSVPPTNTAPQTPAVPTTPPNLKITPPPPRNTPFNIHSQISKPSPTKYPGEELPETGGNIIDLRNK